MPHTEWFIPRPVLFNAALYAISALVYTVTLFVLEVIRPGKYVFDSQTSWRKRFSYLAICSWPLLVFGALILIAVRIGARSRKPRGKRSKKRNKKKRLPPPSTVPPGAQPAPDVENPPPPTAAATATATAVAGAGGGEDALPRNDSAKPKRTRSGRRRSVPRGYVSVTRAQRVFASFGFVWVAVGLGCTSGCGAVVFVGQRERYKLNAAALGGDDGWKSWVIPLITGGLPLVVYAIMAVSTLGKFYWTTVKAKGREVETPATSVADEEEEGVQREREEFDVDVVFERPEGFEMGRAGAGVAERGRQFGYRPDEATVERMMRQLRDMGFMNAHENIAALEAASFDLELASDKLANARVQV